MSLFKNLTLIFVLTLFVSTVPFTRIAHAATGSLTIHSAELVLSDDADNNGYANIGDTITLTAVVSNTDGDVATAGTLIVAELNYYGGLLDEILPLEGVSDGVEDTFQLEHVITDAGVNAIDVGVDDPFSIILVSTHDNDDFFSTSKGSNALGDGVIDTATVNGVDTGAPTTQDTVYTTSNTVNSTDPISIGSSGDVDNSVWLAPAGTTTFVEGTTMTTAEDGTSAVITTPEAEGTYRLFVVDHADNISAASTAELTIVDFPVGKGSLASPSSQKNSSSEEDGNDEQETETEAETVEISFETEGVTIDGDSTSDDEDDFVAKLREMIAASMQEGASTPSSSYEHVATLRSGMSGSSVEALQSALNSVQDPDIVTDSVYGPLTRSAVMQFQASQGLTVDGIVGPNTAAVLQAQLQS